MSLDIGKIEAIKKKCAGHFGAHAGMRFPGAHDEGQRGFTMVELIMVLIIVGILAVTVGPRFMDANVFKSRGFADQVQATLRYAQKEAIAQHQFVCVTFASNSVTLTIGATTACSTNLVSPAGQPSSCPSSTFKICTPSSSITLSISPASNFYFDALGKPWDLPSATPSSVQKSITVSGAPNNIFVEVQTGYVHSP